MNDYVERDGDWVLRPPGLLNRSRMVAMILPANDKGALEDNVCKRFLQTPSGGAVRATPLGFVILLCADMESGWSKHPEDKQRGVLLERDVGIFVPVRLEDAAGSSFSTLLPYLYIDSFAAAVIGREIYGFPKVVVDMDFSHDPIFCDVRGLVTDKLDTEPAKADPLRPAVERQILTVRRRSGAARLLEGDASEVEAIEEIGGFVESAAGAKDWVVRATSVMAGFLATDGLLEPKLATGFASIPMTFLKQFRDVEQVSKACYQSIVSAAGSIVSLRSPKYLRNALEVEIPSYEGLQIARKLGLKGAVHGTLYRPKHAFSAELSFELPPGRTVWRA